MERKKYHDWATVGVTALTCKNVIGFLSRLNITLSSRGLKIRLARAPEKVFCPGHGLTHGERARLAAWVHTRSHTHAAAFTFSVRTLAGPGLGVASPVRPVTCRADNDRPEQLRGDDRGKWYTHTLFLYLRRVTSFLWRWLINFVFDERFLYTPSVRIWPIWLVHWLLSRAQWFMQQ